jgi:hypothetical protein
MSSAMPLSRLSVCLILTLGASIAVRADLNARQGRGGGAPPAAAPDPIPTSAASILAFPATYLGHPVTITASVARTLTPMAFTVDQNRSTAQGEMLIIAPVLTRPPAANEYLTVVGEAIAFDVAEVTRRLRGVALNLPADASSAFLGKPVIIATAIIAHDMSDLTKRPPAPMTPDDQTLSAIMKQVNPAATALRTAATASDAAATKAKAEELKKLFTDAQGVFKARSITTAVGWAGDAIRFADAADAAAATGKWADVTAAATSLTQTCTACHNAHRARQDDGTFRLKTDAK